MPGEQISFDVTADETVTIDGSEVPLNWTAPRQSGVHKLIVRDALGAETAKVSIFVLTPSTEISKAGYLGTYRIGKYPKNTPEGFIRLDKEDVNSPVSPHFKVGQFLCKQQPNVWPKYVLVSSDNLVRLEALLDDLNENRDTEADTLFVMSGFRTPFYNTAIGSAKYSRHMYGDAADVYVDTKPGNGNMDDLNRDGRVTKSDADFLYDYAAKLYANLKVVKGGLGSYGSNSAHGPFVHIDARGTPARWGRSPKVKSKAEAP